MALDYEKAKISYKCQDSSCGLIHHTFESVQAGCVTDEIQTTMPSWCSRCGGTKFEVVEQRLPPQRERPQFSSPMEQSYETD